MKPRLLLLLLVLGLCVCCAGTATAQTKRIDLSDVQKLVNLSDPQIAPDGKSIACIVSRVNWSDDRFDANLVLVDIASGAQRTLTYDRDRKSTRLNSSHLVISYAVFCLKK